jgi:hypothetical protein
VEHRCELPALLLCSRKYQALNSHRFVATCVCATRPTSSSLCLGGSPVAASANLTPCRHVLPICQIVVPVLSSLAITFFLHTLSLAARPVFCSPARPLGSLDFNSQTASSISSNHESRTLGKNKRGSYASLNKYLVEDFNRRSSSFCASSRNPKDRMKTKLAARYSPSARQIA